MRAPISVVIPTLNAAEVLPTCLGTLYEGVQEGLIRELIVVDGGSTDTTVEMAREAGAVIVDSKPSRGGQLKTGCAKAQGDWLLVVHADSALSEGWSETVRSQMSGGQAAYFQLRFNAVGVMPRWVAGWANLRSRLFRLPYGDQGLLIPRKLYESFGGYRDIPLMEDVALIRGLRPRPSAMSASITTSADKYQSQGWLRRGTRNLWTLVRYLLGADPVELAASYRR
ncbi:TIGR04283 family arsenosugar biosynthesis glycosyltransferase [uncultured Shimia sp.]|uniref:TIGR04283 family arsenosugar biosynthesis glycosyltransferase n=1 Tax=uncultured Shimia sp. TaxID=573152 RepID=UPI002632A829|nr:TIGR04283 family arsenosugar biosynthesis glycosyltransferase [uncultured Shimia sp.]